MHYNGTDSYLFVNGTEIHKFKAKDSEIVVTSLCLGHYVHYVSITLWKLISKDFSVDNMKKTGLYGYAYDFSVDYDAISVDDILKKLVWAYSLIINKERRSLYILLEKDDKISNKYCIFELTFQSPFSK